MGYGKKEDVCKALRDAILDLDEDKVNDIFDKGIKDGISPLDMISDGLNAGLTELGEGFEKGTRFMADLVLAGDIMSVVVKKARPEIEKGGKGTGDVMVIGSVYGDLHTIGKGIVSAVFSGAGYKVVDIGEDQPAAAFVRAAKEHNPVVVGASAIIGPTKPYCKVINQALIDAGLRDKVIYIVGGWGMTQDFSENVGADAVGAFAMDGLHKVKAIRAGEIKKLKDRQKK